MIPYMRKEQRHAVSQFICRFNGGKGKAILPQISLIYVTCNKIYVSQVKKYMSQVIEYMSQVKKYVSQVNKIYVTGKKYMSQVKNKCHR